VAKYNKKRARELKQDRFRDTAMQIMDRIGDRLEGKGRAILYGIGGFILIAVIVGLVIRWSNRKADEARFALGRAITIASTPVSDTPPPAGSTAASFSSEQERAQKAIEEFQKVAAKFGDPYRTEARYFIAANLLYTDRNKGVTDLTELAKSSNEEVAALSKFALAQAKAGDGKYDEAAALYRELATQNSTVVTAETANLRLALVYAKQGKKKEAADLLFNIVDTARKAKDSENKSLPQSQAARDASQELQKLDPARYEQLPAEAPPDLPF
jgi:tetratricopeptide (TPR) repeat protein